MIGPEVFGTGAGVYLGLRVAFDRLNAAHSDGDLVEVADYLWQMALRIENGDLSEAERDLRAAEQQLRDALQRNAPEDEIRKLGDNLRAAMDKFMQELAAQQNDQDHRDNSAALDGRGRSISPKDLQKMLDQMQDMLRSGDSANAQKMLERLQNILENLRVARPRKADPRAREMRRGLDELGQMSQDQQDLRDETYQSGQAERHRQHEERGGPAGSTNARRYSLARTAAKTKPAVTDKETAKALVPKAASVPGPDSKAMPVSQSARKRSATGLKIFKNVWTRLRPAPMA